MSVGGIWFHPDPWIQPTLTLAKYSVCMYIKKEIQGVVIYALVTWIYLHLGIACWPKPRKWPKKYRNIEIIARCKLRLRHDTRQRYKSAKGKRDMASSCRSSLLTWLGIRRKSTEDMMANSLQLFVPQTTTALLYQWLLYQIKSSIHLKTVTHKGMRNEQLHTVTKYKTRLSNYAPALTEMKRYFRVRSKDRKIWCTSRRRSPVLWHQTASYCHLEPHKVTKGRSSNLPRKREKKRQKREIQLSSKADSLPFLKPNPLYFLLQLKS